MLTTLLLATLAFQQTETLPPITNNAAPQNFEQMWNGFDPRAEPLETEVLHEWEEDNVVLRIVQFRIGIFKGRKATLVGIYGFPKNSGKRIPGLVQIHGGGQYADHKACLTNAKRGYATISIAWAGRISAPNYRVSPKEVQLFWDGKKDDPSYRITTDWGALDGYHAPGRNKGNVFPSAKAAEWTLDEIESPRNSGWFLCAIAARRALTFLEQQPEVDADRLGVYGHSMGGKLTVMASVDPRVKAAAPSCGGISDRYNASPLFRATIGDDVSLKNITCPIVFLSPSNDFHGRIGDLPDAINEIKSSDWRVTCSPHHNHQDTPEYEVATQLWFDQHLMKNFRWPSTPGLKIALDTYDNIPMVGVVPHGDYASVDIFYTQHGKDKEEPKDMANTKSRFWHHVKPKLVEGEWVAKLPLSSADKPLWVFANVRYRLNEPITGAGYYYGIYNAESFNVSSFLTKVSPEELQKAGVKATQQRSLVIETFEGNWRPSWFSYRPDQWIISTHKLRDERWAAPESASLAIDVRSDEANKMVMLLDGFGAEMKLHGGTDWQQVVLEPSDFKDADGNALADWEQVRTLKLSPAEHLRSGPRNNRKLKVIGGNWKGSPPEFRNLRWFKPTK